MTKSCFRMLNTLYNLGPAPEPNLTVLWSAHLPENWEALYRQGLLRQPTPSSMRTTT